MIIMSFLGNFIYDTYLTDNTERNIVRYKKTNNQVDVDKSIEKIDMTMLGVELKLKQIYTAIVTDNNFNSTDELINITRSKIKEFKEEILVNPDEQNEVTNFIDNYERELIDNLIKLDESRKKLVCDKIKESVIDYYLIKLREIAMEYGDIKGNAIATLEAAEVITSDKELLLKEFLKDEEQFGLSPKEIENTIDDSIREVIKLKIGVDLT